MGAFIRVASVIDVKLGQGILEEVRPAKALAIFNVDRTVHAIHNTCIHWGGPLGEGNLVGSVVPCPWHGLAIQCDYRCLRGQSLGESGAV